MAWLGGLLSCAGGNGPVSPPDSDFPAGGVPPGYRAGDIILRDAEVTLAPTTKVFTHDEDVFLLAITDFGARYSFSTKSPTARTVHAGDVIAGVKGDGFLRKVVSIDLSEPGLIVFVTKPATMEEAVSSAKFEIAHRLTPAGVREVSSADAVDGEGASRIGAANPEHFYIQLKDLVIFDKDKNPYTVFDQATLSGFIDLEPVFNISVVIDEGVVKDFVFQVDAKLDSDLTVKVGGGTGFVDERTKIATYYFNPVVFIAEDLPVVLTPKPAR
jgi:hypothetical protein